MYWHEDRLRVAALDLLESAKQTLERGWTCGAWALDAQGKEILFQDSDAVSWCLGGSLRRQQGDGESRLKRDALMLAQSTVSTAIQELVAQGWKCVIEPEEEHLIGREADDQ